MNKILFIEPKINRQFYKNPMHLQYLASYIKKNIDISIILLDLNIQDDIKYLDKIEPTIVIISTPYGAVESIQNIIKKFSSSKFIFTGEVVTDGLIDDFLALFPKNKIKTFPLFSEIALLEEIKKDLKIDSQKEKFQDDNYSYDILFTKNIIKEYEKNGFQIFINGISRGCEEKCTFCRLNNSPETSGVVNSLNYIRTLDTISKIISFSKKKLYIQFADENFFGGEKQIDKEKRFQQIFDFSESISSNIKYQNINFGIDTRIDTVINIKDNNSLKELRDKAWRNFLIAGLKYVYIGLESVSKSQIKRYGKHFNTEEIIYSISYLNEIKVDYTLGLIIFDPITTVEEIRDNIDFIKQHSLYPYMASLLKEIRIQVKSPYYKLFKSKSNSKNIIHDYLYCDEEFIKYTDARVQEIVPIIRIVSKLFRNSGYRHSDISRLYILTDSKSILNNIPSMTIKLEIDIIEFLIFDNNKNDFKIIYINKIILNYVNEIISLLDVHESISIDEGKVHNYYLSVFDKIKLKLPITLTSP